MNAKQPCVYLLASGRNGTLYTGVTSNPVQRVWQHREELIEGFTRRYSIHPLVWFEVHETMRGAIVRERAMKKWRRAWKIELIEETNPRWSDLCDEITGTNERGAATLDSRVRGHDEAGADTMRRVDAGATT